MDAVKEIQARLDKEWEEKLSSLPEAVRNSGIELRRYYMTSKRFKGIFPSFCEHILEQYPGWVYVFVERDAIPVYTTMEVFRKERKLAIENRLIAFTTDMLPEKLKEDIADFPIFTYEYNQEAIERYLKTNRSNRTLLHDYLNQELGGLDKMLFVDTGYWGRCTGYMRKFFSKKETKDILLFGIKGSNCFREDCTEENFTNLVESLKHGFEIEGLKRENGKIVVVKRPKHEHARNLHIADYSAIEILALEYIHGKVGEDRIKEVLERVKYTAARL